MEVHDFFILVRSKQNITGIQIKSNRWISLRNHCVLKTETSVGVMRWHEGRMGEGMREYKMKDLHGKIWNHVILCKAIILMIINIHSVSLKNPFTYNSDYGSNISLLFFFCNAQIIEFIVRRYFFLYLLFSFYSSWSGGNVFLS